MRILFLSHLSTNIAAGLNWSVPASIKAQEQIDEVLWINTTDKLMPHWKEAKSYKNLKDFGEELDLQVIPKPFDRPDVVVFEGLYFIEYIKFSKELRKAKIPYIIIPRGSMTRQALHNHAWLKKWFAHKIYFNSFIRHAWKIQYLTRQEADDSRRCFKKEFFIVPNGVTIPIHQKESFNNDSIKAVFVGRLDLYHKGLDLLLFAVQQIQEDLREVNFTLSIYGPKKYDYEKIALYIEQQGLMDIVEMKGVVTGMEKEQVLLTADLFLMPSRFEGHPMGLIEALAYGLPCLVTPGSNMAEEIEKADAGWTCEGKVDDIRKTLLEVLNQKERLLQKGKNAHRLSLRYDWDQLAKKFHDELGHL